MREPDQTETEAEYPHWGRVYAAVIVFTALTILGLWLFSRMFE